MRLFVGLDVSSFDIKACILNGEGNSFSVNNDLPSATALKEQVLQCIANQEIETFKIGLESTSFYSFHPSMFLHYDEDLQRFGTKVFLMNPKQIANFKKSYSDMDKTDEIDAFVIATLQMFSSKHNFYWFSFVMPFQENYPLITSNIFIFQLTYYRRSKIHN